MVLGQSKKRKPIEEINKLIPSDSLLVAVKHLGVIQMRETRRAATLFVCKCGNECVDYCQTVIMGRRKSCGCLAKNMARRNAKYDYWGSDKLRTAYYTMINRCYNKADSVYKWYGERGVRVCEEWKSNPQLFFDWGRYEGVKRGMTLDKDILGDGLLYSPKTCCWVTHKENCNHRRRNGRQSKSSTKP